MAKAKVSLENDMIFLIHESGAYSLVVKIEDIDWRANEASDGKE